MTRKSTAYRKDQIKDLNRVFETYREKRLTVRDSPYYVCVRCTQSKYNKTYYTTIKVKTTRATIPLCMNCIEGMKLFYATIDFPMEIETNLEFAIIPDDLEEEDE